MDTTTEAPSIPVAEPGTPTPWPVTVRNDGTLVDRFTFEPLGDLAPWCTVDPPELGLLPGQEETVSVLVALPRESVPSAGIHPVALRVRSEENPDVPMVAEGEVEVAAFVEVAAELGPRISVARGRRRGRHDLAIDNRGNTPVRVELDLLDPEEQVRGTLKPLVVEVGPGQSSLVKVAVRARRAHWRGANQTLPFEVLLAPQGSEPFTVQGKLLQRPVFPSWAGKALLALVALAVLTSGLWFAVLRPTIESSARSAAAEESKETLDAMAKTAEAGRAATDRNLQQQDKAIQDIKKDQAAQTTPTVPGQDGVPVDVLGDPLVRRLAATAGDQSPEVVLDAAEIVSITDLLLQNPDGSSGTVKITQEGETVYVARLDNFRDLDLHLVAPFSFAPGDKLGLIVTCTNAPEFGPCTPAVTVSGFGRAEAAATAGDAQ